MPSPMRSPCIRLWQCHHSFSSFIGSLIFAVPLATAQVEQSKEKPYDPCVDGPTVLRLIDQKERAGAPLTMTETRTGQKMAPEEAAEKYISECYKKLSTLPGLKELQMVTKPWETNLEFMKWWLRNRREKTRR